MAANELKYNYQGKSVARYLVTIWCFWWCSKVRKIKRGHFRKKNRDKPEKMRCYLIPQISCFPLWIPSACKSDQLVKTPSIEPCCSILPVRRGVSSFSHPEEITAYWWNLTDFNRTIHHLHGCKAENAYTSGVSFVVLLALHLNFSRILAPHSKLWTATYWCKPSFNFISH